MREEKPRKRQIVPLDILLKIDKQPFKMSKKLMWRVAFWGQNQSSYERAREILNQEFGYSLSVSTIKNVTNYVGKKIFEADKAEAERLEEERQNIPVTPETEDILFVMIDGAQVNTIEKNAEGSTWRENKLAVVFKQKDVKNNKNNKRREIRDKEYMSLLGSVGEFEKYLFSAAYHKGYPCNRRTVVVSDGAPWIKNICDMTFPDAVQILDYYHLVENIHSFAKVLYVEDEEGAKRWAEEIETLVYEGRKEELFDRVRPYKSIKVPAGTVKLYHYLEMNKERIDYAEYRAAGYCIGSGAVESGNKAVVHKRLKQAGMRMCLIVPEHMLSLRAKDESGLWPDVYSVLCSA